MANDYRWFVIEVGPFAYKNLPICSGRWMYSEYDECEITLHSKELNLTVSGHGKTFEEAYMSACNMADKRVLELKEKLI